MVPKIAFLFLISCELFHPEYWQDFFKGNDQHYSIHVHSKECMPESAYLKTHEMPIKVPTSWANTMNAQIALLQEALKDPENQKFVFVSESTIPLQNFNVVYAHLMQTTKSQFWFIKNPFLHEIERNLDPIPSDEQYFNFQWVILNRSHVQLLVDAHYHQDIITRYACDNEHYPATVLAANNQLDEIIAQDTTFVIWPAADHSPHPITFSLKTSHELDIIKQGIKDGYFFARKFAKDSEIHHLDPYLPYRFLFNIQKYQDLIVGENLVSLHPLNPMPCKKCGALPLAQQNIFPAI